MGAERCTWKLSEFHKSLSERGVVRPFTGSEDVSENLFYFLNPVDMRIKNIVDDFPSLDCHTFSLKCVGFGVGVANHYQFAFLRVKNPQIFASWIQ